MVDRLGADDLLVTERTSEYLQRRDNLFDKLSDAIGRNGRPQLTNLEICTILTEMQVARRSPEVNVEEIEEVVRQIELSLEYEGMIHDREDWISSLRKAIGGGE